MKLINGHHVTAAFLGTALVLFAGAAVAQDRPNDNRGRPDDRGRHDDRGRRDNDRKDEYRFRQEDRGNFSSHYRRDIQQWQKRPDRRHQIRAGDRLPNDYRSRLKTVPPSYYRNVPPPPPGYRFGYYDGYVVAYNPTTQIIADVLDLVDAVVRR